MKRRDLMRHLSKHGCKVLRAVGKHTVEIILFKTELQACHDTMK